MFYNRAEDEIDMNEDSTTKKFADFHQYYTNVIDTIGILGNVASLIIFIRIYLNRKSNTCILYTFLCGINILYIFNKNLNLFKFKIDLSAQVNKYTQNSLDFLLAWMQVLISFNRFIYVVFQSKAKIFEKKVFKFIFLY